MSDSQPPPAGSDPPGSEKPGAAAPVFPSGRSVRGAQRPIVPGSGVEEVAADPIVVKASRAGRNLPAAIVVGLSMLIVVLVGLLIYPMAFVVIVTAFSVIGVWEVSRALLQRGISVPLTPVLIGTLAMPASSYFAGGEGLLFVLVASSAAVLVWRSLDSTEGAVQSIFAGVFLLTWIPFLISFVFLQLRGTEGPTTGITWDWTDINVGALQVAVMLLLVVSNDTAGYLVGVLFGKHPMAPKISPKKSWEGFGGSVAGAVVVAVPAAVIVLHQPWWLGLVLALGMVASSTAGDLAESMVKRELGVKDMSSILPGHGGVMDRLDSILFAAPSAFIIFTLLGRFQT